MSYRRLTLWLLLVIALCALSVQAQSGRRQTKPPPAAPVPTPTPEPSPVPKKDQKDAEFIFLVASDRRAASSSIPFSYHDAAQRACAERLRTRSSADVDVAQRDMTRGEAIEKAKLSPKTYVVLLTLVFDTMSSSNDDLQLDFLVLEPTTAKVVITGRSYLNSNRKGPLIVGPTGRVPGGGLYYEEWLRKAGEDVADRILKKLNLGGGPVPR